MSNKKDKVPFDGKTFTPDELLKLKSAINGLVVCHQQLVDVRASMSDLATDVATELDIDAADVKAAAATLHKQTLAKKRKQQTAIESIFEALGYDIEDEDM